MCWSVGRQTRSQKCASSSGPNNVCFFHKTMDINYFMLIIKGQVKRH
jgi:hypothetical protein